MSGGSVATRVFVALACSLAIATIGRAEATLPGAGPGPSPTPDEPLLSTGSPIGDIDYVPGRGLRLGWTGLHIGAFTTLEIDDLRDEPARVELDGLNFLVSWEPLDFVKGFAEVEIGGLLLYDTESDDVRSDVDFQVERLYADLGRSDALNLRIGKFQTPIGIWNVVPAEPFTWTANDPVLVETAFDEHQTGGALFGRIFPGAGALEYQVYGQFVDPLDPSADPPPADRSVGARLRYGGPLEDWALGASFLASEDGGRWSQLAGVDGLWQKSPLELQAEWVIVRGDIPDRDFWGAYAQGVYHLGHHTDLLRSLHVVGRYEYFDSEGPGQHAHVWNVGLAWTPWRFLIVKGDYQFVEHRTDFADRGLYTSISLLF